MVKHYNLFSGISPQTARSISKLRYSSRVHYMLVPLLSSASAEDMDDVVLRTFGQKSHYREQALTSDTLQQTETQYHRVTSSVSSTLTSTHTQYASYWVGELCASADCTGVQQTWQTAHLKFCLQRETGIGNLEIG